MNTQMLGRLVRRRERPYGTLLFALTTMLAVYPFLGGYRVLGWIFDVVLVGVVVAALRSVYKRGHVNRLGWALGVATFAFGFLERSVGIEEAYPISIGLRSLFFTYLIVLIGNDIFRRQEVTFDSVMGASCVLVLLGLTFGSVFALMEWITPGSFSIPAESVTTAVTHGRLAAEFDLVYFSFITLTTTGYGDVLPLSPPARGLAAVQALLAQLYLTIMIARLVGLEIARRYDAGSGGRK